MEFAYKDKIEVTHGFYKGRKGRILEQRNRNIDNMSYLVEIDLGEEGTRKIEIEANDMKLKKSGIWDLIP